MIRFENTLEVSSLSQIQSVVRDWRGTLTQYAGRLHRLNVTKKEVIIYNYGDFQVPVLAKMYGRRCAGYKAIGYEIITSESPSPSIQLKMENL